jgi:hypothetical protein
MAKIEGVDRDDPGKDVMKLLQDFHSQLKDVGGVFNAYEKALHFGILTEAYRRGWWEADQEVGHGAGKCDCVLPVRGGGRLWLEVKQWWFLHSPTYPWVTLPKMRLSPIDDWAKLHRGKMEANDLAAVLLMRAWDTEPSAKSEADEWLRDLRTAFEATKGPCRAREPVTIPLDAVDNPRKLHGDLHVWWRRSP